MAPKTHQHGRRRMRRTTDGETTPSSRCVLGPARTWVIKPDAKGRRRPTRYSRLVPGAITVRGPLPRSAVHFPRIPTEPGWPPRRGRRRTATRCRTTWWKWVTRYGRLEVCVPVETLLECGPDVAQDLVVGASQRRRIGQILVMTERARKLVVFLDYPLAGAVEITVEPPRRHLAHGRGRPVFPLLGYLLWALARAYRHIYRRPARFGIWGHAIRDLIFTRIEVADGRFRVAVDS